MPRPFASRATQISSAMFNTMIPTRITNPNPPHPKQPAQPAAAPAAFSSSDGVRVCARMMLGTRPTIVVAAARFSHVVRRRIRPLLVRPLRFCQFFFAWQSTKISRPLEPLWRCRITTHLLLLLFSAACLCGFQFDVVPMTIDLSDLDLPPDDIEAPQWIQMVAAEQLHTLQSAGDYIVALHKRLAEANARQLPGGAEFQHVVQLLSAPWLPIREKNIVGEHRFRSIEVTKMGVFAYSFHRCRFTIRDAILSFGRPGGYAVVARKGKLYRNNESSFVFVGTRTTYNVEGQVVQRSDSVGLLFRKSNDRYVMIFDPAPDFYELYEIGK